MTTRSDVHDDIEAIKQLKARYFRTMDTKDWDGLAAVFTDDVETDGHYHETYEKTEAGWRIKSMTITRLHRLVDPLPPAALR